MPAIAIKPLAFPVATESIVVFGYKNHISFEISSLSEDGNVLTIIVQRGMNCDTIPTNSSASKKPALKLYSEI